MFDANLCLSSLATESTRPNPTTLSLSPLSLARARRIIREADVDSLKQRRVWLDEHLFDIGTSEEEIMSKIEDDSKLIYLTGHSIDSELMEGELEVQLMAPDKPLPNPNKRKAFTPQRGGPPATRRRLMFGFAALRHHQSPR